MVPNDEPEEVWKRTIDDIIRMDEELLSRMMNELGKSSNPYDISRIEKTQKRLDKLIEEKDAGYPKLVPGANCMYNAGDCYGLNIPGNMTFFDQHQNLGFKIIPYDEMQPGDIVQDTKHGVPGHAMIYDGNNRFNYAKGEYQGNDYNSKGEGTTLTGNYVTQGQYPLQKNYSIVYRYVGTPSDITRWTNEYNKLYK